MTTATQVKKLVRPVLERDADLALVGRWICVKPVHHIARAILIDRMLNPDKFRPQWAVIPRITPPNSPRRHCRA